MYRELFNLNTRMPRYVLSNISMAEVEDVSIVVSTTVEEIKSITGEIVEERQGKSMTNIQLFHNTDADMMPTYKPTLTLHVEDVYEELKTEIVVHDIWHLRTRRGISDYLADRVVVGEWEKK